MPFFGPETQRPSWNSRERLLVATVTQWWIQEAALELLVLRGFR